MKTQRYLLLLSIICLSFLLIRCSKDGAVGPQGDKGTQGLVGPAGPKGADGSDGSVIYSGNTVPATSKGVIGDFYLDTSTGLLYGPKTNNGWGTGFSLKGANGGTGATGAAGSTTLSGAGLPAVSLGKTGDYYLDKTNYLLYGPKTASSWGVPINLRGPAGNANVKTDVFTVATADWLNGDKYLVGYDPGRHFGYETKYYDHANALITADVLNSGMVLVYFEPDPFSPGQWQPLPFFFDFGSISYTYYWAYKVTGGNVRLEFWATQLDNDPPDVRTISLPTRKFKVIIVTGTLLSAIKKNHINVNNYNEVSRFLGIQ